MTEQGRSNSPQSPFKSFQSRMVFRSASPTLVLWYADDKETIPLERLFEISRHWGEVLNSGKVSHVQRWRAT
jgi:hypothetical protein